MHHHELNDLFCLFVWLYVNVYVLMYVCIPRRSANVSMYLALPHSPRELSLFGPPPPPRSQAKSTSRSPSSHDPSFSHLPFLFHPSIVPSFIHSLRQPASYKHRPSLGTSFISAQFRFESRLVLPLTSLLEGFEIYIQISKATEKEIEETNIHRTLEKSLLVRPSSSVLVSIEFPDTDSIPHPEKRLPLKDKPRKQT